MISLNLSSSRMEFILVLKFVALHATPLIEYSVTLPENSASSDPFFFVHFSE